MRSTPLRASAHVGRGRAPRRPWWAPSPRWSTVALAAWRAVVLVAALLGVAGASPPCGQPGLIGLASTAELTSAGDLVASLTLTDAAVASLSVLPRVFVDGLAVASGGPLALSCGEEVAWSLPAGRLGRVEHAVHWTVLPWPPVAPAVAALDADEALAMARGMVDGAARLLVASDEDPEALRRAVTSPGGMTAAAVEVFERAGLAGTVADALAAAVARAAELQAPPA